MKITVVQEDEVHVVHHDVRYVCRISRADEAMVSIEKFYVPVGLTMDDDGVQDQEPDDEQDAFADILLEPQVVVVLAQFTGAMALAAHAENLEDK